MISETPDDFLKKSYQQSWDDSKNIDVLRKEDPAELEPASCGSFSLCFSLLKNAIKDFQNSEDEKKS